MLVWIFQQGHLQGLLGFHSNGGVVTWLPLFLFAVLFGLSMDYHVFILSRIRELRCGGLSTEDAVERGIRTTASTVTSAAFVMVGVFAIFATLSTLDIKQMGVGLAIAVLIDATIIRGVLLPATMTLLGDWNWYLPRGLGWLPKVQIERAPQPVATRADMLVSDRREHLATLLYLVLALPLGAVVLATMIAGWVLCILSAITPLVAGGARRLPRSRRAGSCGSTSALAESLLGVTRSPRRRDRPAGPATGGARATCSPTPSSGGSRSTCVQRLLVGWVLAGTELAARCAWPPACLVEPIDYRWTNQYFGSWHVDTLARAFLFVPAGLLAARAVRAVAAAVRLAGAPPDRRAARWPRIGAVAAVRTYSGDAGAPPRHPRCRLRRRRRWPRP